MTAGVKFYGDKSSNPPPKDEFTDYPLWIRNVYYEPFLIAGHAWTFWQYTDTEVLEGYQGSEKYIDRNVFHGPISSLSTVKSAALTNGL